jgi:hypothetical protein
LNQGCLSPNYFFVTLSDYREKNASGGGMWEKSLNKNKTQLLDVEQVKM